MQAVRHGTINYWPAKLSLSCSGFPEGSRNSLRQLSLFPSILLLQERRVPLLLESNSSSRVLWHFSPQTVLRCFFHVLKPQCSFPRQFPSSRPENNLNIPLRVFSFFFNVLWFLFFNFTGVCWFLPHTLRISHNYLIYMLPSEAPSLLPIPPFWPGLPVLDSNFSPTVYKILVFFFWPYRVACRILVPRPGVEPGPLALRAQS